MVNNKQHIGEKLYMDLIHILLRKPSNPAIKTAMILTKNITLTTTLSYALREIKRTHGRNFIS